MTRFGVNPTWILRAPLVSFDSIIDSVEALSRSRKVTKGLPKLFRFRNTDTLISHCKNEMRIGEPVERTSSRMVENAPGNRLTPSAM
jgi:hypothetical protein